MTTLLDALKAALEAKRQQRDQYGVGSSAYDRAYDNLDELLTDDTIAALIAVAEAAKKFAALPGQLSNALAPLVKEETDEG